MIPLQPLPEFYDPAPANPWFWLAFGLSQAIVFGYSYFRYLRPALKQMREEERKRKQTKP